MANQAKQGSKQRLTSEIFWQNLGNEDVDVLDEEGEAMCRPRQDALIFVGVQYLQ